jgi:hypothetical protein
MFPDCGNLLLHIISLPASVESRLLFSTFLLCLSWPQPPPRPTVVRFDRSQALHCSTGQTFHRAPTRTFLRHPQTGRTSALKAEHDEHTNRPGKIKRAPWSRAVICSDQPTLGLFFLALEQRMNRRWNDREEMVLGKLAKTEHNYKWRSLSLVHFVVFVLVRNTASENASKYANPQKIKILSCRQLLSSYFDCGWEKQSYWLEFETSIMIKLVKLNFMSSLNILFAHPWKLLHNKLSAHFKD